MKIVFDEKAKKALEEMIENSNENYIRVKPFIGCGKPAYEIYADFKGENDIEELVDGITFVVHKEYEKIWNVIEIKYDKEVYNKGFYIKSISKLKPSDNEGFNYKINNL